MDMERNGWKVEFSWIKAHVAEREQASGSTGKGSS